MPYIQDKEELQTNNIGKHKLDKNHLVIERVLQDFLQVQDEVIQNFIQEGLFRSSEISQGQDSRMEDDLIRFSGILILDLYEEKEKLKKEIQETQRILSSELPLRNIFWKIFKFLKRKISINRE